MTLICTDANLWAWLKAVVGADHEACGRLDVALSAAERMQPLVVLLDVKVGGNAQRAVEWIPRFLRVAPGVAVILISASPTVGEVAEADALGAYAVADRNDARFASTLLRMLMVARDAVRRRRQRALPLFRRRA